jgi:signal transduction histidine kinase
VVGPSGKRLRSQVVETSARPLIEEVRAVAGRRHLCLEEGTLAGWLYEMLEPHVHELVVVGVSESRGQKNDLGRPADVLVSADHGRVRQVLVNIIGNAVKFTPEGGSVTVTTRTRAVAGVKWGQIRVTDTGPGIAPADTAAIFEPYYRSEGTAQLPGVGLGLAISHALVQQMGGRLEVESDLGVGSSFILLFPRVI